MNDPRSDEFKHPDGNEELPMIEMTSVDREVRHILDTYESERDGLNYRALRAQCLIAQQLARIADTFDNWNRTGVPVEKVP